MSNHKGTNGNKNQLSIIFVCFNSLLNNKLIKRFDSSIIKNDQKRLINLLFNEDFEFAHKYLILTLIGIFIMSDVVNNF